MESEESEVRSITSTEQAEFFQDHPGQWVVVEDQVWIHITVRVPRERCSCRFYAKSRGRSNIEVFFSLVHLCNKAITGRSDVMTLIAIRLNPSSTRTHYSDPFGYIKRHSGRSHS